MKMFIRSDKKASNRACKNVRLKLTHTSQNGMTLIEIMIALLIGLFLLGGIIQIFLGTKQTYRMQENLGRLQESGRLAMDFITKDIRASGFQGCPNLLAVNPTSFINIQGPNTKPNPLTTALTMTTRIQASDGLANNWSGSGSWQGGATLPCTSSNYCIAGTDAITVQYGESCGGYVTAALASTAANITIPAANTCEIKEYDTVMISDCNTSDVFVVTTTGTNQTSIGHNNTQNTSNDLSKAFSTASEVFKFRSYSYYIRTNPTSGLRSLYRLDNTSVAGTGTNPIEIIEGVENMQIAYGVDTDITVAVPAGDGVANYYVPGTAANIPAANWAKVVSLRVSLVVASVDDNLTEAPISYVFDGATVTPTDRRLRKVFTSTVDVRDN